MPGLTSLTPEARAEIITGVARGIPLDTVCLRAGIGSSTLRTWRAIANGKPTWSTGLPASPEAQAELKALFDEITRATAEYEQKALDDIKEMGQNDGKGRRDWRSRAWVLEHHPLLKTRWSQQRDLKVDQQVTVTELRQQLISLNEADLLALTPARYRDLLDDAESDQHPDQAIQADPDPDPA